jgi:hypothetical protein
MDIRCGFCEDNHIPPRREQGPPILPSRLCYRFGIYKQAKLLCTRCQENLNLPLYPSWMAMRDPTRWINFIFLLLLTIAY